MGSDNGYMEWLTVPLARWATASKDIAGLLIVGSHARDAARPDSDIDVLLLVDDPEQYVSDQGWLRDFGLITRVETEDWGSVTSLRVFYRKGGEVEFGLARPTWAEQPLDAGTRKVLEDGFLILSDPRGLLRGLPIELKRS